jgi:hypothetical protein
MKRMIGRAAKESAARDPELYALAVKEAEAELAKEAGDPDTAAGQLGTGGRR